MHYICLLTACLHRYILLESQYPLRSAAQSQSQSQSHKGARWPGCHGHSVDKHVLGIRRQLGSKWQNNGTCLQPFAKVGVRQPASLPPVLLGDLIKRLLHAYLHIICTHGAHTELQQRWKDRRQSGAIPALHTAPRMGHVQLPAHHQDGVLRSSCARHNCLSVS